MVRPSLKIASQNRGFDPSKPPARQPRIPPTREEYEAADDVMLLAIWSAAGRFEGKQKIDE